MLAEGKIAATGHVAGETGRRDIKLDEWSSYYVNLFKDELSNKPGTKLADFPSIASVRVSAEDLRQELLNRGYDSHGPKTARAAKKPAVRKAIRLLGQTNLTPLLGKERVKKIIAKVKDESGLSVSPRLVQTVWSEVRQVRA